MIQLNEDQEKALYEVTHDLMLIAGILPDDFSERIAAVLGTLHMRVVMATEEEATDYASRAQKAISAAMDEAITTFFGDANAPTLSKRH